MYLIPLVKYHIDFDKLQIDFNKLSDPKERTIYQNLALFFSQSSINFTSTIKYFDKIAALRFYTIPDIEKPIQAINLCCITGQIEQLNYLLKFHEIHTLWLPVYIKEVIAFAVANQHLQIVERLLDYAVEINRNDLKIEYQGRLLQLKKGLEENKGKEVEGNRPRDLTIIFTSSSDNKFFKPLSPEPAQLKNEKECIIF
ncbi:MAG: hypothetical protein HYX60_07470 [Legionella longbeachae]|nr:hypothetical protein [Legionella longbeachae]